MGFFKRTQKPSQKMDDCEHLSALGADPQAWDELTDEELKQVIGVKFIEYGATQDGSLVPGRFFRVSKAFQRLQTLLRSLVPLPGKPFQKSAGAFVPIFQIRIHPKLLGSSQG